MPLVCQRRSKCRSGDTTAVFMTSSYLILLAFFVVLTSISRFEPAKSEQVLESVTRAFGSGLSRVNGGSGAGGAIDELAEAAELYREIARLVETQIAIAEIRHVEPGRLMEISVPAATVFAGDSVLPDAQALLGSVARLLRMPGGRCEHRVEFVVREASGALASPQPPIGIWRAGSVARALTRANAPAGSISIGIEPGDPRFVRFVFRTVERGADRVSFGQRST